MILSYNNLLTILVILIGASFVVKGLSSFVLLSLFLFSLYKYKSLIYKNNNLINLILFSYLLYPASVFFSQFGRGILVLNEYDSPIRFLIAIPIVLLYLNYKKSFTSRQLFFLISSFIISILFDYYYIQNGVSIYPGNRFATIRFDPLLLSAYISAIALSYVFLVNKNIKILLLLVLFYILLATQSRTGITPFIILLPFILFIEYKFYGLLIYLILIIFAFIGAYYFDSILFERLTNIANIFLNLDNLATTKYEIRYVFAKVFYQIFNDNFLFGIGVKYNITNEYIANIVGDKYVSSEFINGPHNQFLANAVNWGFLGLLSSVLILFSNLYYFIYKFIVDKNKFYIAGIFFNTSLIISCLSIEIFNIKSSANIFILLNIILMKEIDKNE